MNLADTNPIVPAEIFFVPEAQGKDDRRVGQSDSGIFSEPAQSPDGKLAEPVNYRLKPGDARRICAWCQVELPPVSGFGTTRRDIAITHGICPTCFKNAMQKENAV